MLYIFITLLLSNLFFVTLVKSESPEYDIIIQGGRILDGTGNPWFYADIGINGNRITAIGDLSTAQATKVIDASGLYVTPGFIDAHSHASSGLASPELSEAHPLLAQGITTVVVNPDGGGPVDLEKQKSELLEDRLGVNVAQLIPHGSIRREVMGTENRSATEEELSEMKDLVRKGMEHGAFGLSSGLFYVPGSFAPTEELIALCKIVAGYGGIHQSHIRDESNYTIGVTAAVDEIIGITQASGVTGIVTHIKALGTPVWGTSGGIIERINRAREKGFPVFADQYPYSASATSIISALVPTWAREGGTDAMRKRLEDDTTREKILRGVSENLERRGGAGRIQYRRFSQDPSIEGRTLDALADERDLPPEKVILSQIEKGNPTIVSFNMDDDDVEAFMKQPWTMTSSDGGLVEFGRGVPHPRNNGTFPRKIRKYVFEKNVITLEHAIRSMTSLTASTLGMYDRGVLRPGMAADIAIFDPDRITDRATYQDPHQLAEGMEFVIVNGSIAVENGNFTSELSGKVILHQQQIKPY